MNWQENGLENMLCDAFQFLKSIRHVIKTFLLNTIKYRKQHTTHLLNLTGDKNKNNK